MSKKITRHESAYDYGYRIAMTDATFNRVTLSATELQRSVTDYTRDYVKGYRRAQRDLRTR